MKHQGHGELPPDAPLGATNAATQRAEEVVISEAVKAELERLCRESGIRAVFSAREKQASSLLKKMIKKRLSYEDVTDKAGARVVVRFQDEVNAVAALVESSFVVYKRDDKIEALPHNEVGYLATHFDVSLSAEQIRPTSGYFSLRELRCEIQIHTVCQNVWAELAHALSYKPELPVPAETKRKSISWLRCSKLPIRVFLL